MNHATRYPQPIVPQFGVSTMQLDSEQSIPGASAEINRLLTAAVVNRRFCRLLLTNPLAALAAGYRGEAFHLNPTEISRMSAIRATSLRDFAFKLLVNDEIEVERAAVYASVRQGAPMLVR